MLSRAIEARYALEVPAGGANLDALTSTRFATIARRDSVEAVPESEMRRTLERWLGPAANSGDLPVPALVNFDVGAGERTSAQLKQRVQAIAPGARIIAHRDSVAPLLHSLTLLQVASRSGWCCCSAPPPPPRSCSPRAARSTPTASRSK